MLIDTCIVYDWISNNLNQQSVNLLPDNSIVSVVSIWEMHIKNMKGQLPLPKQNLVNLLLDYGFSFMPISASHAQAISTLPSLHKDPFDRMLIAQAIAESMAVATYDEIFQQYLPKSTLILGR